MDKNKYFLGFIDKRPKILAHYVMLAIVFHIYFGTPLEVLPLLKTSVVLAVVDNIIHRYIIKED